jgi:hypothetical protein
LLDHSAELYVTRSAADPGEIFRLGETSFSQERAGQLVVGMLAGMD